MIAEAGLAALWLAAELALLQIVVAGLGVLHAPDPSRGEVPCAVLCSFRPIAHVPGVLAVCPMGPLNWPFV